jgi:hypothetical protein
MVLGLFQRYPLPIAAVAAHTTLAVLVWAVVQASDDPETLMAWIVFEFVDWPCSKLIFPAGGDNLNLGLNVLILGGLQWFGVGCLLQLIASYRPRNDPPSTNGEANSESICLARPIQSGLVYRTLNPMAYSPAS